MGELPTGGAAFIAGAAGGCWGGGRRIPGEGGGVIWPVDIPEGEGALFGTKGRALGQPLSHKVRRRGSWVGDAQPTYQLRQFTLGTRTPQPHSG